MRARVFSVVFLLAGIAHAEDDDNAVLTHQRLRDRYGVEVAARLLRSSDPEEHLRGIDRAAEIATPLSAGPDACKTTAAPNPICEEAKRALELLSPTDSPNTQTRTDSRSALALARALAPFAAHAQARNALANLVNTPPPSIARGRDEGEGDAAGRIVLARGVAAMALATSNDTRAVESLVAIARAGGIGQQAAAAALAARGISFWSPNMPAPTSSIAVDTLVHSGDLRALDLLRAAAKSPDAQTRAHALLGLGQLGDGRALELAMAAIGEKDARIRQAAAEVFVLLDAPQRFRAVEALIKDEVTAPAGVKLAERAQDEGVTDALKVRAVQATEPALKQAIVRALGMGKPPLAVSVLIALAERDPTLEPDIAQALARSPAPVAMAAIERMAQTPAKRRLALRAYFVRRAARDETSDTLDRMMSDASKSKDAKDRAVAIPARVALGDFDIGRALDDPEPTVRRASALSGLATDPDRTSKILLERLTSEKDSVTRTIYAASLRSGDPGGALTTSELLVRAQSGAADAPLAALALARRVSDAPGAEPLEKKLDALLASPVASVRAHAAFGLAESKLPSATGKLADLAIWEVDPDARRAALVALGARDWRSAPIARRALESAAKLDPDNDVRFVAQRLLLGLKPPTPALVREVAWLHASTSDGGAPPKGITGTILPARGYAIPFAFDDDGYALVPGIPIGEASVVLAPRVPGTKP